MTWLLRVLLVAGMLGLLLGPIQSQTTGEGGTIKLDLPNSDKTSDEEEEDLPEVITFFDNQYEGEGFFFCCDHSSSMNHTCNGRNKLQVLKDEMIRAVNQMSSDAEFSIVFFDASLLVFSDQPVRANPAGKMRGINFIMSCPPGHGTCMAAGGVKTLEIANRSTKRYRTMILVTDGMPSCNGLKFTETLRDITAANLERIPIHTLFIGDDTGWEDAGFLQQIASMNGGTFRIVCG